MMNNKSGIKRISFLILFSMILGLCGCSLAVENADSEQTRDHLIGGLVTREYIGEEKIYAAYEMWGNKGTPEEYRYGVKFGDIKGQFFYFDEKEDENGETSHIFYGCGSDVDRDEETSTVIIKLSNVSYYMPGKSDEDNMLYLNPVYETPEGDFYVVSGISEFMGTGMNQTGASSSLTMSEEDKLTFGAQSVLERVEISAEFIVAYEPVKIWISQFDEKDQWLKTEEYLPDEIPWEYPLEKETEYVVAETEILQADGTRAIQREISEWDGTWTKYTVNTVEKERKESRFWTFSSDGEGFLTKKSVLFLWP